MAPAAQILWETEAVVAVAKPAGAAVHRGWAEDSYPLLQRVRDTIGGDWVYAAHRLDRATSGVVLFAKSAGYAGTLGAAFREGRVEKRYFALTRGRLPERGVVDHPVPRQKSKRSERVEARTGFLRIATVDRFSWALVRPETGRLHQIRRHFKHLSHPLVGDVNYGKGDINRRFRDAFALHRLALHAAAIAFEDPCSGDWVKVDAPVPADLADPLARFGLPEEAISYDPWGFDFENGLRPGGNRRDFPSS